MYFFDRRNAAESALYTAEKELCSRFSFKPRAESALRRKAGAAMFLA